MSTIPEGCYVTDGTLDNIESFATHILDTDDPDEIEANAREIAQIARELQER